MKSRRALASLVILGVLAPVSATAPSVIVPSAGAQSSGVDEAVELLDLSDPAPAPDDTDPLYEAEPVRVPAAGVAEVLADGSASRAGDLPIEVAAVEALSATGPLTVAVETLDQTSAHAIGAEFLAFTLTGAGVVSDAATVEVTIDYSGFAHAYGGDFAGRQRLLRFPGCVLETPDDPACSRPDVVASTNDRERQVLVAEVAVDPGATETATVRERRRATAAAETAGAHGDEGGDGGVYVLSAGETSASGSYTATPLTSAQEWQVGLQAGSFGWSYPIPVPPATVGSAPSIALSYSSQAADGMTARDNSQPGVTGIGWQLTGLGFIERRYWSCRDDGWGVAADFCWKAHNATISFGGQSDELVPVGGGIWRLRHDPGWKVQRLESATLANGDNDGEHWVVTTPDGTKYDFGGRAITASNHSTWTVPVFGDDSGDECHVTATDFSANRCQQAWRWNLDRITDPNGNITTINWQNETNYYGREGYQARTTLYDRGGYPTSIQYSTRSTTEQPPTSVLFTYSDRCASGLQNPAHPNCVLNDETANDWPDVPEDLVCGTDPCFHFSPTFFTTKALTDIWTFTWDGSTKRAVDRIEINYSFPKRDTTHNDDLKLWLNHFQRTAHPAFPGLPADMPPEPMPVVDPSGAFFAGHPSDYPDLWLRRVTSIKDEYGGEVVVTYGQPHPCPGPSSRPEWDQNVYDCFPVFYGPSDDDTDFIINNKWLVTKVTVKSLAGGSPASQVYTYTYGESPAWHDDDDPIMPDRVQTWSDWRGHSKVTVHLEGGATDTRTEYRFFRGMNGDALQNNGVRSASIVDSRGTSKPDDDWLAGQMREMRTLGTGSAWITDEISTYTTQVNTSANGRWSRRTRESQRDGYAYRASGGAPNEIHTQQRWTYDSAGFPLTAWELGVVDEQDGRCTSYEYARNTSLWMMDYIGREVLRSGSCTTGSVAAITETHYDGATSYTTAPTKGNATEVRRYDTPSHFVATETAYDIYGRVTAATDPLDHVTTTSYAPTTNSLTQSRTVTNARGYATTTTFERLRLQPATVTDHNGHQMHMSYDGLGRLTAVRLPTEPVGTNTYEFDYHIYDRDVAGSAPSWTETRKLLRGVDPNEVYTLSRTYFDGLARVRQVQSPGPSGGRIITATSYDSRGLVSNESLPFHASGSIGDGLSNVAPATESRYTYDAVQRTATEATWAAGGTSPLWTATNSYDGFTRAYTSPDGHRTDYVNDAFGRLAAVHELTTTGAAYAETRYSYTARGQLHQVEDDLANVTSNVYDLLGRRTQLVDPDMGTWTFGYDDNGNLVRTTDALGVELWTNYDNLDRPIDRRTVTSTGPRIAEWTYYEAPSPYTGLLQRATTYDGADAYVTEITGYDARNRPTGKSVTLPASLGSNLVGPWVTTYDEYDAADHVIKTTHPAAGGLASEQLTAGYSALGLPETLSGASAYVTATGYLQDGKLGSRTIGSGSTAVQRTYDYDPATQRLSRVRATVGATTFQDDTYDYDPDGNITSILEAPNAGQVQCFTYDHQHRLERAWTTSDTGCDDWQSPSAVGQANSNYNLAYTYDTIGNITSVTSGAGPASVYSYTEVTGGPHAVESVGPSAGGTAPDTYSYDVNGALTSRTVGGVPASLTWSADHRLATYVSGGSTTRFVYDPDGHRLVRRDPDGTTTLYLGTQEINRSPAGNLSAIRYYSLENTTVAMRKNNGALQWLVNNHQASVAYSVAASTGAISTQRYLPFGARRGNALPIDRGFLGKVEDDASDLVALDHRYYDASLGRFINVDPLAVLDRPQTLNPYSYAANNPISYADPTGLLPFCICGHGGSGGGGSGGGGSSGGGSSGGGSSGGGSSGGGSSGGGGGWSGGGGGGGGSPTHTPGSPASSGPRGAGPDGPAKRIVGFTPPEPESQPSTFGAADSISHSANLGPQRDRLPRFGKRPYRPPKSGPDPKRVRGGGFEDAEGNIWWWAKDKPEWDVQHRDGRHTNVSRDGEVTHSPDNFPNRPRPIPRPESSDDPPSSGGGGGSSFARTPETWLFVGGAAAVGAAIFWTGSSLGQYQL